MKLQYQTGASLVEVMIAVLVFMVIMVGGMNYFTLPQMMMARKKIERLAIAAAQQKMERILSLPYSQITADSSETKKSVLLDKITGKRNTTIAYVDDASDGTGNADADQNPIDYKTVTVTITWIAGSEKNVSLTTRVSDVIYSDDNEVVAPLQIIKAATHSNGAKVLLLIKNNSGATITVSWLKLTYSSTPSACYQQIWWHHEKVYDGAQLGSGQTANFSSSQKLLNGAIALIEIKNFKNCSGGGHRDMTGTPFTMNFSDGSTLRFTPSK